MPKGDKYILKADIKDGFTIISNTLLVAIALSKLSGLEVRAMVSLWRQTYGWMGSNEKHKKEEKITLSEWASALNTCRTNAYKALKSLENKKVIKKKSIGKGKSIIYATNTYIAEWSCVNKEMLAKQLNVVSTEADTSVSHMTDSLSVESPTPLDTDSALPKETINKYIKKNIKESIPTTPQELEILELLQSVPGWVYEEEEDLEWLRELSKDYPNVEALLIKECRDYFSEKPAKKGLWKNRLRQWLKHEQTHNPKEKSFGTNKGNSKPISEQQYEESWGKALD